MNYSTYRFTLDIHKTKSQVSIPVLFQDTGIQFYINLTDGGKPYHIAEGCKAVLYGKKPLFHDDTGKYDTLLEECEIIDDGTRIRYEFSDQTTTQLGSVACEIRLYSAEGKTLTSPAFEILVGARVVEDDEIIESQDERSALDRLFEDERKNAAAIEKNKESIEANAAGIIVAKGQSNVNSNAIDTLKRLTIPQAVKEAKAFATEESEKAKTYASEVAAEKANTAEENANAYAKGVADSAKSEAIADASKYTDKKIGELLDGENLNGTYDTLKEIDTYIKEHGSEFEDVVKNLNEVKTSQTELAANVDENTGKIAGVEEKTNMLEESIPVTIKAAIENTAVTKGVNTTPADARRIQVYAIDINNKQQRYILDEGKHTVTGAIVQRSNGGRVMTNDPSEDYQKSAVNLRYLNTKLAEVDEKIANVSGSDTGYVEDAAHKRIKKIPIGAYPYAFVNKIGGKTEKVTEYGENILTLSASGDVTLADGVFSVTVPPTDGQYVMFNGISASASLNPYITYKLEELSDSGYIDYYMSGTDSNGDLIIESGFTAPKTLRPIDFGIVEDAGLSVDLSYYLNETSENKTATFAPSLRPVLEKLVPAPVTSVISQGRNLVDDVSVFRALGYELQSNGYWLAKSNKVSAIYSNVYGIPNRISIGFSAKAITTKNGSIPLLIQVIYADGKSAYVGSTAHGYQPEGYYTIKFTTDGRVVKQIKLSYADVGSYEIKDLMISFSDSPLPYEPYSYSERAIPSEITSLDGYGESGNLLEFDKLEYTQTKKRVVFTGAETEGWRQASGSSAPYMYYITIEDKTDGHSSECTYFEYGGEAESIDTPIVGTFTEWYGDKDIGFYSDIPTLEEWRAYLKNLSDSGAPLTVLYELKNSVVTDVSEYDINPISIADEGTVIFDNEAKLDIPNTIEYVKRIKKEE